MINEKTALVSVIIPTKNRLHLLNKAVESVARQTYTKVEIIIIDDGSTNAIKHENLTVNIEKKNIIILRNEFSEGGAAARNKGIAYSRGEYIAFLDDDDIYYPVKLAKLVNFLINNPEIDLAFGKVMRNNGILLKPLIRYPKTFSKDFNAKVMNYIHTASSLIRRSALEDVKFRESLNRYQDLQFYLELSAKKKVCFIDEFVAEWSIDQRCDQITSNVSQADFDRSYNSFKDLNEYLKESRFIDKKYYIIYDIYQWRLSKKSTNKDQISLFNILVRNAGSLGVYIKSLLLKKWYFTKL